MFCFSQLRPSGLSAYQGYWLASLAVEEPLPSPCPAAHPRPRPPFQRSELWDQVRFLSLPPKPTLHLAREISRPVLLLSGGDQGSGVGSAYLASVERLAPILALRVTRIPKHLRRSEGSKLSVRPAHVQPSLRYRALLRQVSFCIDTPQAAPLASRVSWVISDLSKPGLQSSLFSRKARAYKEIVRQLKRRL